MDWHRCVLICKFTEQFFFFFFTGPVSELWAFEYFGGKNKSAVYDMKG